MYDDFPKLIELGEFSPEGEPTIQIVRPGEYNRLYHVKTASDALDYIKNVKPIPGKTAILVLAMTAGEFYGPNRNGDSWPERPLIAGKTKIGPDAVLPKHYKTFETNANIFKHHINKDPEKRIGEVLKAFYNWDMHRVELLLSLDHKKAEDIVERIEREEFPAVSMGCKVKFDICSICGNKAPSRKQYCDHAKFRLGEYIPSTGKRIFVWNPSPKFFDISMVRRPADKHGFMMKKVAEAVPEIRSSAIMGEYIEDARRKVANIKKMSLIKKVLDGAAVAAKEDNGDVHVLKDFGDRIAKPVASSMKPLSDGTIRDLLQYHPAEVLSTLSSMGILLTTPEFVKYFVWKVSPGTDIPEGVLERVVACQQNVFALLANNPQLLDDIEDTGFVETADKHINSSLAKKAFSLIEKRSQAKEYLYRHLVPQIFKGKTNQGNWDVVNVRDPKSGKTYRTTRLAARSARDAAGKRQIQNLVGGGALLAGAAGLSMVPFAGLAAGPLAYAGAKKFSKGYQGYPSARAETGEQVVARPTNRWSDRGFAGTELVEKRSSHSNSNDTNMMIHLAMDIAHCPGSRNEHVNTSWFDTAENVSFDDAIAKLGEVICP